MLSRFGCKRSSCRILSCYCWAIKAGILLRGWVVLEGRTAHIYVHVFIRIKTHTCARAPSQTFLFHGG